MNEYVAMFLFFVVGAGLLYLWVQSQKCMEPRVSFVFVNTSQHAIQHLEITIIIFQEDYFLMRECINSAFFSRGG
jgi:hypothetical protein